MTLTVQDTGGPPAAVPTAHPPVAVGWVCKHATVHHGRVTRTSSHASWLAVQHTSFFILGGEKKCCRLLRLRLLCQNRTANGGALAGAPCSWLDCPHNSDTRPWFEPCWSVSTCPLPVGVLCPGVCVQGGGVVRRGGAVSRPAPAHAVGGKGAGRRQGQGGTGAGVGWEVWPGQVRGWDRGRGHRVRAGDRGGAGSSISHTQRGYRSSLQHFDLFSFCFIWARKAKRKQLLSSYTTVATALALGLVPEGAPPRLLHGYRTSSTLPSACAPHYTPTSQPLQVASELALGLVQVVPHTPRLIRSSDLSPAYRVVHPSSEHHVPVLTHPDVRRLPASWLWAWCRRCTR